MLGGPADGGPTAMRLGLLDVVAVDRRSVRAGRSAAALDRLAADPAGSLASAPDVAAVAGCLDDPLAARLTTADAARLGSPIGYVGVGAGGDAGSAASSGPVELLCAAVDPATDAERVADRMRRTVAAGRDSSTGRPWAEELPGAEVVVRPGPVAVVRLSARDPAGRSGLLFSILQTGALADLVGG